MRPAQLQHQSQKKTLQESYKPISFMKMNSKIFSKRLARKICLFVHLPGISHIPALWSFYRDLVERCDSRNRWRLIIKVHLSPSRLSEGWEVGQSSSCWSRTGSPGNSPSSWVESQGLSRSGARLLVNNKRHLYCSPHLGKGFRSSVPEDEDRVYVFIINRSITLRKALHRAGAGGN